MHCAQICKYFKQTHTITVGISHRKLTNASEAAFIALFSAKLLVVACLRSQNGNIDFLATNPLKKQQLHLYFCHYSQNVEYHLLANLASAYNKLELDLVAVLGQR